MTGFQEAMVQVLFHIVGQFLALAGKNLIEGGFVQFHGGRLYDKNPSPGSFRFESFDLREKRGLDIQILDVQRVVLDEFAADFHILAHQGRENLLGFQGVFQAHLQEGARLGVHGGGP